MEALARVTNVRIAPVKLRTVVDLVRGKDVGTAQGILASNPKINISRILTKLLNQALANAKENLSLDVDALYVKTILVDQGPSLKRYLPRMRGRADRILKRTSDVTVVLDEREQKKKVVQAAPAGKKGEKAEKGAAKGKTEKKTTEKSEKKAKD